MKTMNRVMLVVCLAFLVGVWPATAQQQAAAPALAAHPKVAASLEVVRVWLDAQRDYEEIPGLSAAVVHDQDVLWSGGFGFADLSTRRPAGADTIYSICSISKLFTSIAVMQQRDAGKLRLDDPVKTHLPWLDTQETAPEGGPVTVEGLLTHASGLPRESD
jgi:CubicO group peptidase (beta-lactamase class C family)